MAEKFEFLSEDELFIYMLSTMGVGFGEDPEKGYAALLATAFDGDGGTLKLALAFRVEDREQIALMLERCIQYLREGPGIVVPDSPEGLT
jgi:hypothetical protein